MKTIRNSLILTLTLLMSRQVLAQDQIPSLLESCRSIQAQVKNDPKKAYVVAGLLGAASGAVLTGSAIAARTRLLNGLADRLMEAGRQIQIKDLSQWMVEVFKTQAAREPEIYRRLGHLALDDYPSFSREFSEIVRYYLSEFELKMHSSVRDPFAHSGVEFTRAMEKEIIGHLNSNGAMTRLSEVLKTQMHPSFEHQIKYGFLRALEKETDQIAKGLSSLPEYRDVIAKRAFGAAAERFPKLFGQITRLGSSAKSVASGEVLPSMQQMLSYGVNEDTAKVLEKYVTKLGTYSAKGIFKLVGKVFGFYGFLATTIMADSVHAKTPNENIENGRQAAVSGQISCEQLQEIIVKNTYPDLARPIFGYKTPAEEASHLLALIDENLITGGLPQLRASPCQSNCAAR